MIQTESKLLVADNSGAKLVICIKIIGHSKCKFAYIGDIIKIAIKKCLFKSKVKKGEVYHALIVRTVKGIKRFDGSFIKFKDNSVVILNDKLEPVGTRIFGPITRELRINKFNKVISIASEIL